MNGMTHRAGLQRVCGRNKGKKSMDMKIKIKGLGQ